ncbi:MAG TPA: WYL domain-containing protein [Actinomycetes bacterium]|nr:WYL domain-containing protein [Actinomycetes bacterium]
MSAPAGAVTQLGRLLALIPWLVARPGVSVDDAAAEFGVTPDQLRSDLQLAFVCGLPGHLPDDLIDVSLDGDRIVVSNADTIARPLRFAPDEAVALLVGLRALADVPGPHKRDALERVVAKLERAAGDAADAGRRIAVDIESDDAHAPQLRKALADGCRIHLLYYVPARDEVTERDVDPLRLVVVDGRSYLEGWCYLADDARLFRLDRIQSVTVLDKPVDPPAAASLRDLDEGAFAVSRSRLQVTVELTPAAHWVTDAYPVEVLSTSPDGTMVVTLFVGDRGWVRRLLLRLGGSARVLEPADIADEVMKTATDALAAYPVS